MAIIQQSLKDALADRNLAELPLECNVDADWQEAIVLVARAVGGVQSYAYATKKDGKVSVVRDFGFAYQCSGIKGVLKAYPIGFVTTSSEPKVQVIKEEENASVEETTESNDYAPTSSEEAMLAAEADNAHPTTIENPAPAKKRGRPRGTAKKTTRNNRSIW